jgi:hypothetical protein
MRISLISRAQRAKTTTVLAAVLTALGLAATACGNDPHDDMPGMNHGSPQSAASSSMPGAHENMPDMDGKTTGDGLASSASGFRFVPVASSLPAGKPSSLSFQIVGAADKPVTPLELDQKKLMHF